MKRLVGIIGTGIILIYASSSWGAAWFQRFMSRPSQVSAMAASSPRQFESLGSFMDVKRGAVMAIFEDTKGGSVIVGRSEASSVPLNGRPVICVQNAKGGVTCSEQDYTDSTGLKVRASDHNIFLYANYKNEVTGGVALPDDVAKVIVNRSYANDPTLRAMTDAAVQREIVTAASDVANRGVGKNEAYARMSDASLHAVGTRLDPKRFVEVLNGGRTQDKSGKKGLDVPCESLQQTQEGPKPGSGGGNRGDNSRSSGDKSGVITFAGGDGGSGDGGLGDDGGGLLESGGVGAASGIWKDRCAQQEQKMAGYSYPQGNKASSFPQTQQKPCGPNAEAKKPSKSTSTLCGHNRSGGDAGGGIGHDTGGSNAFLAGDICGASYRSAKELQSSGKGYGNSVSISTAKYFGSAENSDGTQTLVEITAKLYEASVDAGVAGSQNSQLVLFIEHTTVGPDGKTTKGTHSEKQTKDGTGEKLVLPKTMTVEAKDKDGKKTGETVETKKVPGSEKRDGKPVKDSDCDPVMGDCPKNNMDAKGQTPLEKKQKQDAGEKAKGGGFTDPNPEGSNEVYTDECGNSVGAVAPCSALDFGKFKKGWDYGGGGNMPDDTMTITAGGGGCISGKTIKGINPVADPGDFIQFKGGANIIPLSQPGNDSKSSGNPDNNP